VSATVKHSILADKVGCNKKLGCRAPSISISRGGGHGSRRHKTWWRPG